MQEEKKLTYAELAALYPELIASQQEESDREAWLQERIGKITGSCFAKVTKLKNGEWSDTAMTYFYELLSEHLTGLPATDFESRATNWGIEYEPIAIKAYEQRTGEKVTKAGFQLLDNHKYIGCTVDGLVNGVGVIEVKCPYNSKNHAKTVFTNTVPKEYLPQVLGHLLVTGREYCDFISYDPRVKDETLRLKIIRVNRSENETALNELRNNLVAFEEKLIDTKEVITKKKGRK